MIRQQSRRARTAVTIVCTTLSLLALSSTPASADYRAWFTSWDYVGDFQEGDVSEDHSEMNPPAGACGLRIDDPSYYRWTDDNEGTVTSDDLYKDVIIWLDNPGDGCSRPFSVRYHDDSVTFLPPPGGAVSIEISTNYGAHWVNNNGYYLFTCGDCVGADDFTVAPRDDRWSLVAASSFAALSTSVIDPRRRPSSVISAIAGASRHVVELQPFLQQRISDRRREPLGALEASVRGLEDAAAQALAAARASAAACESHARRGAYTDAFVACTTAGRQVEQSGSLMHAAFLFYYQPAKQGQADGR